MPKKDPTKLETNKTQELILIKQLLESAQTQIIEAMRLFEKNLAKDLPKEMKGTLPKIKGEAKKLQVLEGGKIIEGLFDGQNMQGPDGETYNVPPNYASKSKLVEGDQLKLTIMPDGSFVFKQIKPIDRKKIIGTVTKQEDELKILVGDKLYKVLNASATYYKISEGDQVTIAIPKKGASAWCAIENVIKKSSVAMDNLDKIDEI